MLSDKYQEQETTLLSEDDYNETTLLSEEKDDYNETTLLSVENEDDYNETTLLSEEKDDCNETTLLSEAIAKQQVTNVPASIFRNIINQENHKVNKNPFIVGSDRDNVDCYVRNPAVSRHHMDILCDQGEFYILDNNSTNGTLLDGIQLKPYQPVKLYNGALIQVAEELFQFNIL